MLPMAAPMKIVLNSFKEVITKTLGECPNILNDLLPGPQDDFIVVLIMCANVKDNKYDIKLK